jgi:hypothetical protein
MKRMITHGLAFISLCLVGMSCTKETNTAKANGLIGKWQLTETYADIGDGSSKYEAVEEGQVAIVEFKENGEFVRTIPASGEICTGTYTTKDDKEVSIEEKCKGGTRSATYTIATLSSTNLTLQNNACIEGCGEKYIAIAKGEE